MRSASHIIDANLATIEERRTTKQFIQQFHGFLAHHARAETAYLSKQQLRLLRELMFVKGEDTYFHFKGSHLRRLSRLKHFDCLIEGCFFPEGPINYYVIDALKYLHGNHVPHDVSLSLLYEQGCFSLARIMIKIESIKAKYKLSDYIAFSFYLLEGKPNHQQVFLDLFIKGKTNSLGYIFDLSDEELVSFQDRTDSGMNIMAARIQVLQQSKIEAQVEFILAAAEEEATIDSSLSM